MGTYGISPYVPNVVEIVDDKGRSNKDLSVKNIGFNDESNDFLISSSEN